MPYEQSLLCRLLDGLDELQATHTEAMADGIMTVGEATRLASLLAAAMTLALAAESCQRAGAWYARTGRLPRDHRAEYDERDAA